MGILNKEELRKQIREGKGVSLDGIIDEFKVLLREAIELSTQEEMDSHLGYNKHQTSENENSRNGYNKKSLKSKYGEVDVAIPRDRDGTFEPKLVRKRQRLLEGTEDMIISLYGKGLSVQDIRQHLDELYCYELSEQTISNITETIMDRAKEWQNRPLSQIYPIIFLDATVVKVRVDRVVKNICAYIMLGINIEGKKEILGIYIGENESSKYWLSILNEIKNRGVQDVLIFAIDGLNGFNEAISAVYPDAAIQRCIVHQIRSSLKFVSWKDRKDVAKDLKLIYTAQTEEQAQLELTSFNDKWGGKYPHITKSWLTNWDELSHFYRYPNPVRKLIYTTNPIESLNSIIKRRTKTKGSFVTTDSAFKTLYLSILEVQKKWQANSIRDWSEIYSQLSVFFSKIMEKYVK